MAEIDCYSTIENAYGQIPLRFTIGNETYALIKQDWVNNDTAFHAVYSGIGSNTKMIFSNKDVQVFAKTILDFLASTNATFKRPVAKPGCLLNYIRRI